MSKTVQEESIDINFNQNFSKNNMVNIAPPQNGRDQKNTVSDKVEAELRSCSDLISNVTYDAKTKTYSVIVTFENNKLSTIKIKMK